MIVKVEKVVLHLSGDELADIAFDGILALEKTLADTKKPEEWEINNHHRIQRVRELYQTIGKGEMFESMLSGLKQKANG